MDSKKPKKDDWIKVQSKSRPGRFYLFNRSTGETQWLSPSKDKEADDTTSGGNEKKKEAPPKIPASKPIKTPAQDRLKRLQHNFKNELLKKPATKVSRRSAPELETRAKKLKDSIEQQENVADEPTTSSKYKNKTKLSSSPLKSPISPTRANKRPYSYSNSSSKDEEQNKLSKVTNSSSTAISLRLERSENKKDKLSPSISTKAIDKDIEMDMCQTSIPSQTPSSPPLADKSKSESAGIFSKLKEIFKYPFQYAKPQELKSKPIEGKSSSNLLVVENSTKKQHKKTENNNKSTSSPVLSALTELKSEQKKLQKQNVLNKSRETAKTSTSNAAPSHSVFEEALSELRAEQIKLQKQNTLNKSLEAAKTTTTIAAPGHSVFEEAFSELRAEQRKIEKQYKQNTALETSQPTTPKTSIIPPHQRGSANSRLERLRQSLSLHQTNASCETPTTAIPPLLVPAQATTISFVSRTLNTSANSPNPNANNALDDEIEAMDWQPILKEDTVEITNNETNLSARMVQKTETTSTNGIKPKTAETMGEIYDTVNENLLRLSAEKQRDKVKTKKKWLKDFYYFVVDTNVLLEYLTFIEDLSKMKLCDTQGSVLYIPYGVLQELDKLKMRSGCKEGIKTLAVRAIKYLNKKFESNNLNLQAQTALEERDHTIDVYSADDSIINCCLQVKSQVPNIVLLTEDVNLRNKAICNNIIVTTKSDLMCKRYVDDAHDADSS